ncbi:DUF1707 domain-containing protein [Micromonospora sp. NPDC050686]|uniref:DUF1707 SHOCT-like domain-containing protein n=1 Tax=Micromonospora sp. NPDC050686 TaxID=3154631 RepID=UPI0033E0F0F2
MEGRSGMRAADADREVTAERLRVALNEGRLDLHEYDERLQRAYGAKTYGELDGLLADLPGAIPAGPPVPAARPADASVPAPRPPGTSDGPVAPVGERPVPVAPGRARREWLAEVWLPWIRVAGILTAIWLVSGLGGGFGYYWPLWVLGPWGAVVLMQTVGGLATGEPQRAVERKRRRKAERRERRQVKRVVRREAAAIEDGGRREPSDPAEA